MTKTTQYNCPNCGGGLIAISDDTLQCPIAARTLRIMRSTVKPTRCGLSWIKPKSNTFTIRGAICTMPSLRNTSAKTT